MPEPFDPITLRRLELKNRFVRSATYFALADEDGFVGRPTMDLKRALAEGGVGLIVTGYAYVLKSGQSFPDMNGIQTDDHIPGFQAVTRAVHEAGGRIVMQIAHCGAASQTTALSGGDYMAVSLVENLPNYGRQPREMTEEDIQGIIAAFGQAARRVQEAGFDGVQIHGAHGYLVTQFLSPLSNHRTDRWGGPLENRMRFVVEVVRAMRKAVDDDFPVMIKLGCRDYLAEGKGLSLAEGAETARTLEQEGVDFIEISNGHQDNSFRKERLGITSPDREAYFLADARVIRRATQGPLGMVGGMRSLAVCGEVIRSGVVDCVSICRPLIREPGLIRRWQSGDTRDADCISCGGCFNVDEKRKTHVFCRQLKKKTQ
jgi:2,4-dienoyl-CoA reductase-like NADH-dependent reductase (Old Yellow Enzyme family)